MATFSFPRLAGDAILEDIRNDPNQLPASTAF